MKRSAVQSRATTRGEIINRRDSIPSGLRNSKALSILASTFFFIRCCGGYFFPIFLHSIEQVLLPFYTAINSFSLSDEKGLMQTQERNDKKIMFPSDAKKQKSFINRWLSVLLWSPFISDIIFKNHVVKRADGENRVTFSKCVFSCVWQKTRCLRWEKSFSMFLIKSFHNSHINNTIQEAKKSENFVREAEEWFIIQEAAKFLFLVWRHDIEWRVRNRECFEKCTNIFFKVE